MLDPRLALPLRVLPALVLEALGGVVSGVGVVVLTAPHLGARLRGRTTTCASKKGSEKVLGRVLGEGSQQVSEEGGLLCHGFHSKKVSEKRVLRRGVSKRCLEPPPPSESTTPQVSALLTAEALGEGRDCRARTSREFPERDAAWIKVETA